MVTIRICARARPEGPSNITLGKILFTYIIMSLLHRSSRHRFTSETSKYYINCDDLPKEPNSITNEQLITYNIQNDVEIYKALINFTKHNKKNKHIVMKIGYKDKRIHHEFKIGTLLYQYKIPGFIKYICILDCDDVSLKEDTPTPKPDQHVCTNRESKEILLMPFIHGHCIANFTWREQDSNIMKSLLKQIFFSCYVAFEIIGFIHSDLHMENIFMKPTKQEFIHYGENIDIKTYGYKIVINDFDKSFVIPTLMMRQNTSSAIDTENIRRTYLAQNSSGFWKDLERVFLELSIVTNNNNIRVAIINEIILPFISKSISKKTDYKKSFEILNMIDSVVLVAEPKPNSFVYDPNIF